MAIQIEKDIPVPHGRGGQGVRSEELKAMLSMNVGESFFAPGKRSKLSSKVQSATRIANRVFTTRTREENGVQGARVWRIE